MALCRLLLSKPDMLLLDEPTNHLDAESVAWLERFLEEYPSTVIAVTHDRYFLDNVAELDPRARPRPRHPVAGQLLLVARAEGEAPRASRSASRRACARCCSRSCEWVRQNPKARQAKSKARLAALRGAAVAGVPEAQRDQRDLHPAGRAPRRAGDRGQGPASKGFGDRLLIDGLSFSLPRGGIVGIIGPNGAGKTTLFRMLTGHEKPDAGEIRIGPSVKLAYVDQSRQTLDDKKTVWAGDLRRPRHHQGRQLRDAVARLRRPLQLQGHAAAAADRRALRRRTQPRAPRQGAQGRRQRAAARRADQRPRRRDAARARGGACWRSPAARW